MHQLRPRWMALGAIALLAMGFAAPVAAGVPGPDATDDAYSVNEDEVLAVEAPGLLENDNPDATTCLASTEMTDETGVLDAEQNGSFSFTPEPNFHGETSFTYVLGVVDGSGCVGPSGSEATVTITVEPLNDAPTAAADSFQALVGRTLNINPPGVLGNDSDIDGDVLTAVKVSNPAHGIVTLAPDGAFSYTPNAGYTGPDAFSYRASDGDALSATRVVSITVSALPPTPTPAPTATPVPTPTPEPTASPTPEPSPSESAAASPSLDPNASVSPAPSGAPSPTPAPSADPGETGDEGGLSLPVLVLLLLFISLLAFGAAVYVPKWLERQRGGGGPPPYQPPPYDPGP